MDDIHELIKQFAEHEAREAQEANKKEKGVAIKADCYIAKEIKYQTSILKRIERDIHEMLLILKNNTKRK